LKLFFGRETPHHVVIDQLEARLNQMEDRLEQYEQIDKDIKDLVDWVFPHLALQSGLAHVRAEIEWIGDTLELLRASASAEGQRLTQIPTPGRELVTPSHELEVSR
jgi:hypothetical protein